MLRSSLLVAVALFAVAYGQQSVNTFAAEPWCTDPLGAGNTPGNQSSRSRGQRLGARDPYFGVTVLRRVTPALTIGCAYPQCTRIYRVNLTREFTTQCNDYAMLPPHGVNQIDAISGCQNNSFYKDLAASGKLKDWRGEPFKTNVEKQAAARARASVTALTEPAGTGSATDAFPQGFHMDTLHEYHSVCVEVVGVSDDRVKDRWVEIMGQSTQQDRSFCVRDWDNPNLQDNIAQESCGGGELYSCRNSAVRNAGGRMKVMFFCRENCESTDMNFYWRIVSSHETSSQNSKEEKSDNEDWCAFRRGDDYPSSLLQPYPNNYVPPNVFQKSTNSAAPTRALAFPFLVLLALLASLVFLL